MLSQLFLIISCLSSQCTSSSQSTNTSNYFEASSLDEASWTLTKPGLWGQCPSLMPFLSCTVDVICTRT